MTKITFLGAGSTVFAKNILGDCMLTPSLQNAHFALYDIDAARLTESKTMLETLNASVNEGRARISAHLGVEERRNSRKRTARVRFLSLRTLRFELFQLPGRIARPGGRWRLRIAASERSRARIRAAQQALAA